MGIWIFRKLIHSKKVKVSGLSLPSSTSSPRPPPPPPLSYISDHRGCEHPWKVEDLPLLSCQKLRLTHAIRVVDCKNLFLPSLLNGWPGMEGGGLGEGARKEGDRASGAIRTVLDTTLPLLTFFLSVARGHAARYSCTKSEGLLGRNLWVTPACSVWHSRLVGIPA
jgi:hypothetical protein